MKTKVLKNETYSVNRETGEVITSTKTFKINVNQDNFYMCYIENMSGFFKLTSVVDIKVLTRFCMIATFDTGNVVLSPRIRREMMELIGIRTQHLSNSINSLKKLNLISGEKGDYLINPMIFWKGKSDTRNDLLKNNGIKLTFDFNIEEEVLEDENIKLTIIEKK